MYLWNDGWLPSVYRAQTFVIKWLKGLKSNMQFHKNLKCENNFILILMLHFINNVYFWI